MKAGDLIDGRFQIETRVGAGGMGVVYRAADHQTGAPVALKLITAETAEEIRRAMQEIELLATLHHPGIVRHIADGLTERDQLYIAMEWVEGTTLGERLQRDGFTLQEAVVLARGLASALGAAHAANIVHRDIKPSNILLEGDDPSRVRLIDFGLARMVGAAYRSVTRTGMTLGTPGYMSPEQARGIKSLTPASDVFGIGLVLYECATGRPAFSGGSMAAQMTNIVLTEPTPLGQLCAEAPPELQALVASLLAKAPGKRPIDGAAVAFALEVLGPMPDGPRRDAPSAVADPTIRTPPMEHVRCLIMASQGLVEDILDPPTHAQQAQLAAAGTTFGAQVEVLGTGTVVGLIEGAPRATALAAAELALAIKGILGAWAVAVSTAADELPVVAEGGMALLTRAAKAELFARARPPEGITVDARTAELIRDAYEISTATPPRLLRKR